MPLLDFEGKFEAWRGNQDQDQAPRYTKIVNTIVNLDRSDVSQHHNHVIQLSGKPADENDVLYSIVAYTHLFLQSKNQEQELSTAFREFYEHDFFKTLFGKKIFNPMTVPGFIPKAKTLIERFETTVAAIEDLETIKELYLTLIFLRNTLKLPSGTERFDTSGEFHKIKTSRIPEMLKQLEIKIKALDIPPAVTGDLVVESDSSSKAEPVLPEEEARDLPNLTPVETVVAIRLEEDVFAELENTEGHVVFGPGTADRGTSLARSLSRTTLFSATSGQSFYSADESFDGDYYESSEEEVDVPNQKVFFNALAVLEASPMPKRPELIAVGKVIAEFNLKVAEHHTESQTDLKRSLEQQLQRIESAILQLETRAKTSHKPLLKRILTSLKELLQGLLNFFGLGSNATATRTADQTVFELNEIRKELSKFEKSANACLPGNHGMFAQRVLNVDQQITELGRTDRRSFIVS